MVDIYWSDLTKAPGEPNQDGWIVITNEQWEKTKAYIEKLIMEQIKDCDN